MFLLEGGLETKTISLSSLFIMIKLTNPKTSPSLKKSSFASTR